MKVIVTGCYGFIGKQLTYYLLCNGDTVIGLDIKENHCFDSYGNFSFMAIDNILFNDLHKLNVDVMYHLAWSGVSTIDKNDYKKQFANITLTYEILELAKSIGVKKVVIPGSTSEFSKCMSPITGHEKDSPSDLYAATKVAVRKIAFQFCEKNNIDLNWLLITSIYSEKRLDSNLITTAINSFLQHKEFCCTKLEQKWDYLYVDDLIDALYLIGKRGKKNTIYPIGSGRTENLSYYIKYIAKIMNSSSLLKIGCIPYKNSFIDNSIVDIEELKLLGFNCKKSFEYNIVKVIEEMRRKME